MAMDTITAMRSCSKRVDRSALRVNLRALLGIPGFSYQAISLAGRFLVQFKRPFYNAT